MESGGVWSGMQLNILAPSVSYGQFIKDPVGYHRNLSTAYTSFHQRKLSAFGATFSRTETSPSTLSARPPSTQLKRVPGTDGLDLDHAYKAMAWLGEIDAAGRSEPALPG